MPRTMLNIPGLNPFNIVLLFVLIGWFVQKNRDQLSWVADKKLTKLLLLYFAVLIISTARALLDPKGLNVPVPPLMGGPPPVGKIISNAVINGLKWVLPGLLIAHGANTDARKRAAVQAVLITGFLFSIQVISKMLPALIGGDDLASRALRVLDRDMGYHRVDLAALTASSAWAFYAFRVHAVKPLERLMCLGGFFVCSLAMALTGGRAGLLAWLAAGAVLAFLRMRQLLVLLPLAGIVALSVLPGLRERVLEGFSSDSYEASAERRGLDTIDDSGRDQYAITSGRVVVWPLVIEDAKKAIVFGHGRYAMLRRGIAQRLGFEYGITSFGHPHNAYLQILFDAGMVGLLICLWFYGTMGIRAFRIVAGKGRDIETAIGAITMSFLVVQAVAGIGSQSFYPIQSSVMMWVMIGLWIRSPKARLSAMRPAEYKAPPRKL
ncbi:MAG: O-antigen ligase family protein [Pseudomonadota bacterium]